MADISLNVRGRDDGAGALVDSLREKVRNLGEETSRLNSRGVRDLVNQEFDSRRDNLREEYKGARGASFAEYKQEKDRFNRGEISKQDFDKIQKEYLNNIRDLDSEEKTELRDLQIEQNQTLRELLDELRNRTNQEESMRQNDSNEFGGNGRNPNNEGFSDNDDGLRVFVTNWPARFGSGGSGGSGGDGGDGGNDSDSDDSAAQGRGQFGAGLRQTMFGVARGDLSGTIMGGTEMAGGMIGGRAGAALGWAGLITMILKEFIGQGEKVQEAIGPAAAMRGSGNNASLRQLITGMDGKVGALGLSGDELAELVNQKALSSRKMGGNLADRTLDDFAFQKGFGADAGVFSQFERFGKSQDTSVKIALDVLNALNRIDSSSLKSTDLSTLSEKLSSQQAIMSLQRSMRDGTDSDSALRVLAAFEKIGLSDKGERGADFLSQTIQGLGEGGSDNAMLFKYEAAKRARPDLANDPAALRRFVRFNSDDPNYMKENFKLWGETAGGSEMAQDDILYTMFPNLNEKDMQLYKRAIKGGDNSFFDTLGGKGVDTTRSGDLSLQRAYSDSQEMVGAIKEAEQRFVNGLQELSDRFMGIFSSPIATKVVNLPKNSNSNATKQGK